MAAKLTILKKVHKTVRAETAQAQGKENAVSTSDFSAKCNKTSRLSQGASKIASFMADM